MAEKVVVDIEVNPTGKGVGNLKQQLREATNEAQALSEKFGATSKEAIKAAQRAANLREEIADVKQTIDALHPEAKFNAIVGVGQGIAGGFAAAQGAMALFGAESDNVQKALLKVQAAMAISQGLNEINGLRDSFQNLGIVIRNSTLYTKAAAASQGVYNFVVNGSNIALKLFRGALIATGIGAFAVALGSVVVYWEDLTKVVQKNSEQIKKWGLIIMGILIPPLGVLLALKKGIDLIGERFEFVGNIVKKVEDKFSSFTKGIVSLLEQVGVLNTAEENAAEKRLEASKTREAAIKREIELAKAQGASAVELAALDVKLSREKFLAYDQYIKARIKSGREVTDDEKEQFADLANQLKLSKVSEQKVIEDANKKELEENKKKWEAKKRLDEENARKEAELQKQLEDVRIANIRNERERELAELQIGFQRKFEAIRGNSDLEIQLREQIAIQQKQAEKDLQAKFLEEDKIREVEELRQKYENRNAELEAQRITTELAEAETAAIEKEQALLKLQQEQADEALTREQKLLSKANYEKSISDIEKREQEKRLATQKQIESAKFTIAEQTVKGLGALSDLLSKQGEKQSKASKALAIVQLGIDTAKSISATIAGATQAAASGGPAAPLLLAGYIVSGIATVLGAFSQAKKYLGSGSGSDSTAGVASSATAQIGEVTTAAPRLNSTLQPAQTQLERPEDKQFNVTVKAQVLETEMTDSQKRIKDIQDKSTI